VQWPPFDEHANPWPGRIALYPPGVRENGGQYSHGASWLVDALVTLARECGDPVMARELHGTAWRLWQKISPLGRDAPEQAARYGLAPHQQPADIYSGPGHEGRGGWSWYTGAAARMLHAAHLLLGVERCGGEVELRPLSGAGPQRRRVQVHGAAIERD
jgi:cyclic beta-1,2-glucan synthetase